MSRETTMNMRTVLLSIAILIISVQIADAGPASRRANSATGAQVSVPINLNGFGAPLPGIAQNQADLSVFATGQIDFKEVESLPQIGPVMNGVSCAGCHSQPAIGGGGLFINE